MKKLLVFALAASSLNAQGALPNRVAMDSIMTAAVRANRTVGIVAAVVKGKDTLLLKGYGKANLEWDVPMPADAMMEIGSVSKQFAAASILQLVDAGKVSLDDRITKWVPSVGAGGDRVTLRHLLNHTSGIRRFADEDAFEKYWFMPGVPRDSVYGLMKIEPFNFQPGEVQAYNNAGFFLLGLVVEKASGMKYEDYLQRQIFDPLGMKRSSFCNSLANVAKRAHGYGMAGPGNIRRSPQVNYTIVSAPGAVCSTAGDVVTWLQALHGGKVLSPKSYAEMTTQAKLNDGTSVMYGLGIKVGENYRGHKYIGHGGTAPGFRAEAAWYPESQLAVVVLMNTSPTNLSPASVAGELVNRVVPPRLAPGTTYKGDPAPFVGTYKVSGFANQQQIAIEVTASPNGLSFAPAGGRPDALPWAGGLKFFGGETTTLTFKRANGDSGPVTELRRDDAGNHTILKKVVEMQGTGPDSATRARQALFVGYYENTLRPERGFEVSISGDTLLMRQGRGTTGQAVRLVWEKGTTYRVDLPNARGTWEFKLGADGKTAQLIHVEPGLELFFVKVP